ncbi:MAG: hypothetical protein U9N87_02915, partial [Planctomycetota bacterium]|nr:hypothetical protein [Planctomycetota bacterium]
RAAKGDRSWSEYRRDLLVRLSKDIFIDPAKEVNPDITMVIKYPQWYDRFQEFGYDLSRQPALFDRVWVGTETRGSRTLRFGFMQPYEGFVNYRWIAELSHGKIGGAWFDHGDCDAHDFVEQAYQTVLAGAPEIILFNYANLAAGHAGHDLLRRDFANLADLAAAVRKHPVTGVCSYKPANSDSGGDLYVMDFIGMLGIPLVPTARFDAGAASFFLPTQAAADEDILAKVRRAAASGATFVMTAGFLHDTTNGDALAKIAGVKQPSKKTPMRASHVIDGGKPVPVKYGLDLEADLEPAGAEVLLRAQVDGRNVPFLTRHKRDKATVYVLNTHTYSKADFEAVGEVLLAPRPLGLLEIPQSWTAAVRGAFNSPLAIHFDAPPRVTLQPLGNTAFVLCNYNLEAVAIQLKSSTDFSKAKDKFTDAPIESTEGGLKLTIPSRGTVWVVDNL